MIRHHLLPDVTLRDVEVLPASTMPPTAAPLEVRATVVGPSEGSSRPGWGHGLGAEIRAGGPATDFQLAIMAVHDEPQAR